MVVTLEQDPHALHIRDLLSEVELAMQRVRQLFEHCLEVDHCGQLRAA